MISLGLFLSHLWPEQRKVRRGAGGRPAGGGGEARTCGEDHGVRQEQEGARGHQGEHVVSIIHASVSFFFACLRVCVCVCSIYIGGGVVGVQDGRNDSARCTSQSVILVSKSSCGGINIRVRLVKLWSGDEERT